MSTDTWPPRGYDTQATGTGQLLVCTRCGALVGVGNEVFHTRWHNDLDTALGWLVSLREALR